MFEHPQLSLSACGLPMITGVWIMSDPAGMTITQCATRDEWYHQFILPQGVALHGVV